MYKHILLYLHVEMSANLYQYESRFIGMSNNYRYEVIPDHDNGITTIRSYMGSDVVAEKVYECNLFVYYISVDTLLLICDQYNFATILHGPELNVVKDIQFTNNLRSFPAAITYYNNTLVISHEFMDDDEQGTYVYYNVTSLEDVLNVVTEYFRGDIPEVDIPIT